eukprot:TRINITY_DN20005_c0_g1_i1.p1 TRINITY_DN20005_c0_g1~~TRINITY_DN20005_c0_g1_i1.p1  ORF type:complete len:501 (+),score=120.97 TRINITY_DN20005_c0_g1_i1:53-1555(+)
MVSKTNLFLCAAIILASVSVSLRIAVIGGGVAGLSAARDLIESSAIDGTVIVFEARNRLGGRVFTNLAFGSGCDADLGASWIHGTIRTNPVYKLMVIDQKVEVSASDFDDQATWLDSTGSASAPGQRQSDNWVADTYTTFETLLDKQEADQDNLESDISLLDHFKRLDSQAFNDAGVLFHMSTTTEFNSGDALSRLSSYGWNDDEEFFGDDAIVKPGYKALIDILVNGTTSSSKKIDYRLEHVVTRITKDKTVQSTVCPYYVEFDQKEGFCADYVIVAVPLGVLKSNSISFVPELPREKKDAISRVGFGLVNKVFLKFATKFWDNYEFFGIGTTGNQGPYNYWVNTDIVAGTKVLMGVALGDQASFPETRTDQEVVDEAMKRIRVMYPSAPNPIAYQISRWGSDPYAKGAYSYAAMGMKHNEEDVPDWETLAINVDGLFFAGEHTDGEYRGTIHGALLSGRRVAVDLIDYENSAKSLHMAPYGAVIFAAIVLAVIAQGFI